MGQYKIGIIGGGNLGRALATGLHKSGKFQPNEILICRRKIHKLNDLGQQGFGIESDAKKLVQQSEIVVLAVLPQQLDAVLELISPVLQQNQLVISTVTGAETEVISKKLNNHIKVIRAMPNTAISIGESMTCIAKNDLCAEGVDKAKEIFDLVGSSVVIRENQMTSATALCACGIAFFLRAIRAAMQGGTEIDFHADESLLMAAQTAKGAAMLLLENNSHPEDEIDRVTSPKGCTIAGLNEMEHAGFSSSFIKGITTSAKKANNLY
ncbi:MAG: pyrroline-5-carboxylate reductase [Flavobacteriales bacterium]|jgi:pyrroline-5-carboxylate reductase